MPRMTRRKEKTAKRVRKFGKGARNCWRCKTHKAVVRQYGLNVCRRCFREVANFLGFKQFS